MRIVVATDHGGFNLKEELVTLAELEDEAGNG
jgi:ribose 5-phosphate isomerase RpiB